MGNPRILREDDRVEGATITSSGEATGFVDDNVTDWKEYTKWQGDNANSHSLNAESGAPVSANCFAVAGHNLNTEGVTRISLEGADGGGYTEVVADFAPPNGDDAFVKFFDQASWTNWQISIDNAGGAPYDPQIGIWYVGNYIELPRRGSNPHDPDELEDHSNLAVGGAGHLLGLTNDFTTRKHSYSHQNIAQSFITDTWKPFIADKRMSPFIWLSDHENNPNEAYLMAFAKPNHTMPYSGGIWRGLNFDMRGRLVG